MVHAHMNLSNAKKKRHESKKEIELQNGFKWEAGRTAFPCAWILDVQPLFWGLFDRR